MYNIGYFIWKFTREKTNPFHHREPWMSKTAIKYIKENINKNTKVLEFGGGASTLFFSDNCKLVDVIETNKNYINKIKTSLRKNNVEFINKPRKKYDLILVDSSGDRVQEFEESKQYLKRNGVIIFDDFKRYGVKPDLEFSGYARDYAGITTTGVFLNV